MVAKARHIVEVLDHMLAQRQEEHGRGHGDE